jgi:hypothetical protein
MNQRIKAKTSLIVTRTRAALQVWETEGGANAELFDTPPPMGGHEAALLVRLGAAVLGEWNNLPMPLRRAVYDRAVSIEAGRGEAAARRNMARFLHDHKRRPGQG